MVGNDPVNDIAPARSLGLPTWWITNLAQPGQTVETTYQGTLAAFLAWIQTHPTQLSPS
jgi:FMN phosphatase YigB (HAD superfamily)